MELRHLRYFVAVAEELHFGRAAARLGLAQPPLSQQIRRLEGDLGAVLFDRSSRRVRLTDAGRVLLDEARATLAQAERAARLARRAGRGEVGRLVVGFVPSAPLHDEFALALRTYRERHPDVEVLLEQKTTSEQVAALREGRLAAGFLRPPLDAASDAETIGLLPVAREPFVVLLPAGHALLAATRGASGALPLRSLAGEPFVLFPRALGVGLYDAIIALCRRAGFSPEVRHEVTPFQAVAGMVAAGFGVSVLPASVRRLGAAGVVHRELPAPRPRVEIAVAWRRDDTAPTVRAFLHAVRDATAAGGSPRRARVVRPARTAPRGELR